METMGFLISHKNNERRRALLPQDLAKIRHTDRLLFEAGYGEALGHADKEYIAAGAAVAPRETFYRNRE